MLEFNKSSEIFIPSSLHELLVLYWQKPTAVLFAGGTSLLRGQNASRFLMPKEIISLQKIEELKKIRRSEQNIDICAGVTISSILRIAGPFLPSILREALQGIGTALVQNLATLGGNLGHPRIRGDAFTVLNILDARIELRSLKSSRQLNIRDFIKQDNTLDFRKGEILFRIIIPENHYNIQVFKKHTRISQKDESGFNFAVLAKVTNGEFQDCRLAFCPIRFRIYRFRKIEEMLSGMSYPFSEKTADSLLDDVRQSIREDNFLTKYQQFYFLQLMENFILYNPGLIVDI